MAAERSKGIVVIVRSSLRASLTKAASCATGLGLLAVTFVSGCGGGTLVSHAASSSSEASLTEAAPTASAVPAAAAACAPSATLPPQTMNPSGGTLTIPACGAFSGLLAYPSFGGNAGTITATLASSLRNNVGPGAQVPNSGALLYIGITLRSSDPADSAVTFGSLAAATPANCGKIDGPFADGATYYAQGEFPFSAGVNTQTTPNVATSGGFQAAGCSLSGESLTLGRENYIVLGTRVST
jgi:hypothetical protein